MRDVDRRSIAGAERARRRLERRAITTAAIRLGAAELLARATATVHLVVTAHGAFAERPVVSVRAGLSELLGVRRREALQHRAATLLAAQVTGLAAGAALVGDRVAVGLKTRGHAPAGQRHAAATAARAAAARRATARRAAARRAAARRAAERPAAARCAAERPAAAAASGGRTAGSAAAAGARTRHQGRRPHDACPETDPQLSLHHDGSSHLGQRPGACPNSPPRPSSGRDLVAATRRSFNETANRQGLCGGHSRES